jgi:hypothetical protein
MVVLDLAANFLRNSLHTITATLSADPAPK